MANFKNQVTTDNSVAKPKKVGVNERPVPTDESVQIENVEANETTSSNMKDESFVYKYTVSRVSFAKDRDTDISDYGTLLLNLDGSFPTMFRDDDGELAIGSGTLLNTSLNYAIARAIETNYDVELVHTYLSALNEGREGTWSPIAVKSLFKGAVIRFTRGYHNAGEEFTAYDGSTRVWASDGFHTDIISIHLNAVELKSCLNAAKTRLVELRGW